MIYGYARVATDGQSVGAQVKQLRDAGAEKVFRESASGARSDRAGLRRALDRLVTRDRLARSTRDLLNTLAAIAGRGAGFRSLGDIWADTTTAHGRLAPRLAAHEGRREHFRSLFGHPHDHPGLKAGMIDQPYARKFTGDAKIHVDFPWDAARC
jgi:DNA invertase Pin-like site-specific DNA recombinase